MSEGRKASKRPPANKTLTHFLSDASKEDIGFDEDNETLNFAKITKILEHIIKNATEGLNNIKPEDTEAIRNALSFFERKKQQLSVKFSEYRESCEVEIQKQTPSRPINQVHRISRSMSQRIGPIGGVHHPPGQKPAKKLKKPSMAPDGSSKQLSAMTIWNQTNRFFSPVPTVASLSKYLNPAERYPDFGPLGPHYSIAYNEKLKSKFKSDSVLLKIPGAIAAPVTSKGTCSETVFPRLICSIIPLAESRAIEKTEKPMESPHVSINEDAVIPGVVGTSTYSGIPFEEKLLYEVTALGLMPEQEFACQTDNEIAREIEETRAEYEAAVERTNRLRRAISERLAAAEPELIERSCRVRRPIMLLDRPETPKKQIGRPKSRTKSNL